MEAIAAADIDLDAFQVRMLLYLQPRGNLQYYLCCCLLDYARPVMPHGGRTLAIYCHLWRFKANTEFEVGFSLFLYQPLVLVNVILVLISII